jgi:hypothetical protein
MTTSAANGSPSLHQWPYSWYGYWQEDGQGFASYPSIQPFVDFTRTSQYNMPALVRYLHSGYAIAATSRGGFPSPFTGEAGLGSLELLTDGHRMWLSDLPEYIEYFHLAIPDAWYTAIEANGFQVPHLTEKQLEALYPQ